MSAETKEQQKYVATWLNTLSAGSIVAGVITPVAAWLNGITHVEITDSFVRATGVLLAAGVVLHILALAALIGLED